MIDIHKTIIEIAASYDKLCKEASTDPCNVNNTFQLLRQKSYRDFYNKLSKVHFEELLLSIISSHTERSILNRVQNAIDNYIKVYQKRADTFLTMDFLKLRICDIADNYGKKVSIAEKDIQDIKEYPYPSERNRKILLQEFTRELNRIQGEKTEYIRNNNWASTNYYLRIYDLSKSYLNMINSYFPIPTTDEIIKTDKDSQATESQNELYFNMKIVSSIHEICNNEQFEDISELDLYSNLNLLPCDTILNLRKGEKIRTSYLIFQLSELLPKHLKAEWKTTILKAINIDEAFYNSHYKDPISDFPSDANQKFAKKMHMIFK